MAIIAHVLLSAALSADKTVIRKCRFHGAPAYNKQVYVQYAFSTLDPATTILTLVEVRAVRLMLSYLSILGNQLGLA